MGLFITEGHGGKLVICTKHKLHIRIVICTLVALYNLASLDLYVDACLSNTSKIHLILQNKSLSD